MVTTTPLQPTLWRTCRALANRVRLQMLMEVFRQPGQTVSTIALRLNLPLPVTSAYLRALEARGLLVARRAGRHVNYRPAPADATTPSAEIAAALKPVFLNENAPVETIFKLATAFTHPRRAEILRAIHARPKTLPEIQTFTGISIPALVRHLRKLESRGFVGCHSGYFIAIRRADVLGRKLAQIAVA
jgi:DNA-binding MarR family transcriptional regulator